MSLQKSGENRICPNCAKVYYVKPCIANNPKRGKYCSNKCQHEYRVKLGIPHPGAFQSKPKYCATCNTELENKNKKYCSSECKPTLKRRASKFAIKREKLKSKGIKEFKWYESCGVCKKENQIYYTSATAKICKLCHNKKLKLRRATKEGKQKWRAQYNAWRNKKRIEDPAFKLHTNIRSRVSMAIKDLKNYKTGSFIKMFGCTKQHLIQHFESKFNSKMSWDNYGTYWHVDHIIPISSFDLTDPDQCKQANHWTNLQPLEAKRNIAKSNKITAPQMNLMLNA